MNFISRFNTATTLAVFAFASSVSLHGQTVPAKADPPPPPEKKIPVVTETKSDESDEGMIVLSPFEVTAKNDSGYSAGSTLAGNRLNTDLRDVGSAVSVVTAQFLKDIGAYNNETLLQYTTNTEVGNIYGNMANAGSGTQLDETGKFANPNQNTRVRGLASADTTVDYFLTDIPWDGYNTDRVDFQRGPNAILFGLGSPAGIINNGTKSAGYKNRGDVTFRYSRFGSVRATLDVNHVLIDKQLALRIDGLDNKEKFQQEPAFSNDKRVYAALRYDPKFLSSDSVHTTLKANFEQGNVRSNRPRSLTPGDSVTPWFLTGTATGYSATGVPFQYNNLNKIGFDARGLQDANIATIGASSRGQFVQTYNNSNPLVPNATLNPYWQPWLGGQFAAQYFGNPMAIFTSGDTNAQTIVNWAPSTVRGISTTGAIDKSITGIPNSTESSITSYRDFSKKVNLAGAKFGLTRNLTLSDPSIFNFYDQLIDGPNKSEWQNFKHYDVNLNQTYLGGDAGVEVVFDKQHYDNGQMNFMTDKGQAIWIDVIQIEPDGTTNPNFGRPFLQDTGAGGNTSDTDREAFRMTAYAKHDFDKGQHRSLLTRILGNHTLTALYSNDMKEISNRAFVHYTADNAYKDFINGFGSTPQSINSNQRKVLPTIYLGPSLAGASSAAGANLNAPTATVTPQSGSVRVFDSTWTATNVDPAAVWLDTNYPVGHPKYTSTQSENPANYRGWINSPITITNSENGNRDVNTYAANKTKIITNSQVLNWQGYFWDNSFVAMYGYRKDRAQSWAAVADTDTEGRPLVDSKLYYYKSSASVSGHSNSWSAVWHLNKTLKERLPLDVSLFYNRSENFQPLAGRVGPTGVLLPAPTGRTKDLGVLLATKDGKYSLKINSYETQVTNSSGTSGFNPFYLGSLFTGYQAVRNVFKFEVTDGTNPSSFHNGGNPANWTLAQAPGETADQALARQQADVAGWDALVHSLPASFFSTWKMGNLNNQNQLSDLGPLLNAQPTNLNIIENNVSKGYEFELYGQPVRNLRLTFNASKSTATRNNVGDPTFIALVDQINTALNTTAAGDLHGPSSTAASALTAWNANFWASWLSVKGQENSAVPELRKWRANFVANYDFDRGMLKGFNLGGGVRWQDRVIIGYLPRYYDINGKEVDPWTAVTAKFDLNKPYYGPSDTSVDVFVGYSHRINKNLNWRSQINVRNVNSMHSKLIPVTVQPDGTVAAWRIAPAMVWSLTNTVEF